MASAFKENRLEVSISYAFIVVAVLVVIAIFKTATSGAAAERLVHEGSYLQAIYH